MNDDRAVVAEADSSLEALADELTAAAYPVALRHAVGGQVARPAIRAVAGALRNGQEVDGGCREPDDSVMPVPHHQPR
jgi:hypothetical protein